MLEQGSDGELRRIRTSMTQCHSVSPSFRSMRPFPLPNITTPVSFLRSFDTPRVNSPSRIRNSQSNLVWLSNIVNSTFVDIRRYFRHPIFFVAPRLCVCSYPEPRGLLHCLLASGAFGSLLRLNPNSTTHMLLLRLFC